MTPEEKLAALREQHTRLELAARAVVEDSRKAGVGDEAVVATHLLRRLLRELNGEPQPSSLATMGS